MKRIIVFDAVGTLIKPVPDVVTVYHSAGKKHGSRKTHEEVQTGFHQFRQSVFGPNQPSMVTRPTTSEQSERQKWFRLVTEVFTDVAATELLFQELWDHFASPNHWALHSDVDPCWKQLKQMGFYLAVASNFDKRLLAIADSMLPEASGLPIFTSAAIGFSKPELGFYLRVQRELEQKYGNSLLEITMIGDDRLRDYDAPKKAGWNAFHLDRSEANPGRADTLHSLEALPAALAD